MLPNPPEENHMSRKKGPFQKEMNDLRPINKYPLYGASVEISHRGTLGSGYIPVYPLMVEELHWSGGFLFAGFSRRNSREQLGSRPKTRVSSAPNFW